MKKRILNVLMCFFIFWSIFSIKSFAKYIFKSNLNMNVYIDKTPPQIELKTNTNSNIYKKTETGIISKNEEIQINTSDNVKIEKNEYYYNSKNNNFSGIYSVKFDNGKKFTQDGYYKFVVTDTSENKTEIIVLLDKSAPDINVTFYKDKNISKNSSIKSFSFKNNHYAAEEIVSENVEYENCINEGCTNENIQNEIKNQNNSSEQSEVKNIDNEIKDQNNVIEKTEAKNIVNEISKNETTNSIENTNMIENKISNISSINNTNNQIVENTVANTITNTTNNTNLNEILTQNELEKNIVKENRVINNETKLNINANSLNLMASADAYVGNETEFRNALVNKASVIHVRQSINFTSPIYINYTVRIIEESDSNSLRYGKAGNFIVVQNGGGLIIDGMVIDTRSLGVSGIYAINVQNGGTLTFWNSSIVDAGLSNTGILINSGATVFLWSCEIVNSGYGINLQGNGNLYFGTQDNRKNNFYSNTTAIFIDNFNGTCNMNQNICMHDNSNYGIYISKSSGTINISSGTYYNNKYGVHTKNITGGKVTISGGSYYSNGWGIWAGGNLNFTGGSVYQNYNGVVADEAYSGKFIMSGGSIYSNTNYAIYQTKREDGGCTILGGTVTGNIYLSNNDNYVNTNSKYPKFTVFPSSYYYKRKLVKTSSNANANSEIGNVSLVKKDNWYKIVDNEYIVLGSDDYINVAKVNYKDELSGIKSAKYWYNANSQSFSGNGTNFSDGTVFKNYGYYKCVVENSMGLKKELTFVLNKNSV